MSPIEQVARSLGFAACGVAPAGECPDRERFLAWLEAGRHGEMRWIERDPARRTDPRRVLEGCRSVVVAFMNHYPGELPPRPRDVPRGRIARFALGLDYHPVVLARLRGLARAIEDPDARCYVDTGPVVERAWAERSGIGWVGRNAMFIVPGVGSYGFLGVILTRADLPATPPGKVTCGSCAACVPACPTGAIISPGQIDARRCTSYLTIELRGAVPRDLRPLMGDWVFGCDDCQDPCPWNRKPPATAEGRPLLGPEGARNETTAAPEPDRVYPRLDELLLMTQEQYAARFRGSAIKRAKRAGLARNAAIALGNSGDPGRATPPLRQALAEATSALVRGHAAWALGRHGDRTGLREALGREADAEVLAEIRAALAEA
jgi:epoxyqueuosine reductase